MTMAILQTFDRGLHMASPLRFLPFSGAAGWRTGQHRPTNVGILSDKGDTIRRRVREATAIRQRMNVL